MNFIHVGITLQHNKEREYDRKKNYWKTYRKRGSQATTFNCSLIPQHYYKIFFLST